MTPLWFALLLLHQGYTLVPVVIVEPGQSVTLSCALSTKYQSNTWLYWYKQTTGDTLNVITRQQRTIIPKYGPEFSASRFNVTCTEESCSLTILTTVQQDEGMYHCAQVDILKSTWSGTYLSITGKTETASKYTVVQHSVLSDSTRPADSDTRQCSVLSDAEDCSGEPSVFWFKAGSDKYFPDVIYTDGNRSENCDMKSNSQKRCYYNFSKNVSSSDAGTYYCAVATCGQILLGNGVNLEFKGSSLESRKAIIIFILSAALTISLIGIALLVCSISKNKCECCQEAVNLKQNWGQKRQRDEDRRMYSAANFTVMKMDSLESRKTAERQLMFAAVKAFSL